MNSFVKFVRAGLLAFAFAAAVPVVAGNAPLIGTEAAQAAVVRSVVVHGNSRVDAETVRNYITIKPGKNFGPADVDASIKSLFSTGLFSDVSITPSGATLIVTVVESPIINEVIFSGNKKIKSNILVALVELKPRGVLSQAKLDSDTQRLKAYYARSGRAEATITPQVTPLPNNRVDITFVVDEGGRTGVKTISFVGNQAYSAMRLRGIIQTRQTNILSWLNRRDVYSPEKLDADQESLRRFYMSHGYADFRVLSADGQMDPSDDKYHVVFTLDEGQRYRFGAINIDSAIPGLDSSALSGVVTTKSGSVFDSTAVEKSVEELTIALANRGYSFAQVRPRGDRDYANHTIAITYMIDEGPRVYVERIDIHGNTKTRDYVIRREFDLSEGDAYNRVLVDKAERRLRALDYFTTVSVTTEPGSAPDKVIINVLVDEKSTGSFAISAGVSTTDGFIAEVSMNETNFLGRGQYLKLAVGSGSDDKTYTMAFTDPYFLGTHMAFGIDAYRNTSSSSTTRPFDTQTTGGGLRLGLPITDQWTVTYNYRLFQDSVSDHTNCGTYAQNCYYFPDGDTITSSLGYQSVYSTIDSMQDPHEGVYVKFSQDFAGAGGDTKYVRSAFDSRVYREAGDTGIVSMVRVQGGNITGLGGADVRVADNFFKGGETVRGFESLGWGPRDLNSDLALGGKTYVAATAEVQFPLPMMPPDFGLRGAVFADAGTMWGVDIPAGCATCTNIADDQTIRSSVGLSLLWASPFGALRADFSQVLSKASYDKPQLFRISAGTQF